MEHQNDSVPQMTPNQQEVYEKLTKTTKMAGIQQRMMMKAKASRAPSV